MNWLTNRQIAAYRWAWHCIRACDIPILSAAQKRARASGSILRFALGRGYIAYWQRLFHCCKLVGNWWKTGEKCQQAGGES